MAVSEPAAPVDGLDLTPRRSPRAARSGGRRLAPIAVLLLVLVGVGFVAAKALSDASLFFYNADEAVARKPDVGTRRFRLQGTVEDDVVTTASGVAFTLTFNGAEVKVNHVGDPPELFKPGQPVVLEGHWDASGTRYDSDRMLIKHDAKYVAKNGDRLTQADQGGTVPPAPTTPSSPPSSPPSSAPVAP